MCVASETAGCMNGTRGRQRRRDGCHSAGFTAVLPGPLRTPYMTRIFPPFKPQSRKCGADLAAKTLRRKKKKIRKEATHSRSLMPPSLLFISATLLPPTSPWRSLLHMKRGALGLFRADVSATDRFRIHRPAATPATVRSLQNAQTHDDAAFRCHRLGVSPPSPPPPPPPPPFWRYPRC